MVQKVSLNPSLMIIPGISVIGGIEYDRKEIESQQDTDSKTDIKTWQTTRITHDAAERKAAVDLAGKLKSQIKKDTGSVFTKVGYVCPVENEDKIDAVEHAVRKSIADFNTTASYSKLEFNLWVFNIASTDTRAMAAMAQNINDTLKALEKAMASGNIHEVRQVVGNLVGLDAILPLGQGQAIKDLIASVRKQAREVVKAAVKAGKTIDEVQVALDTSIISKTRLAVFEDDGADYSVAEEDNTPSVTATRLDVDTDPDDPEPEVAEPQPVEAEEVVAAADEAICLHEDKPCASASYDEDNDQVCTAKGDCRFTEFLKECPLKAA